jgi:hypothetical protein
LQIHWYDEIVEEIEEGNTQIISVKERMRKEAEKTLMEGFKGFSNKYVALLDKYKVSDIPEFVDLEPNKPPVLELFHNKTLQILLEQVEAEKEKEKDRDKSDL